MKEFYVVEMGRGSRFESFFLYTAFSGGPDPKTQFEENAI